MDTSDPKGDTPIPSRMTLSPEDVRALNTASEMIHRGMRATTDLDRCAERFRSTIGELNATLKPLAAAGSIRGPVSESIVTVDDGLLLRSPGGYEIAFVDLNTADCTRVLRAMPGWLQAFTADAFTTFETLAALQDIADTILGVMRGGTVETPGEAAKAPETAPAEDVSVPVEVRFGEVHYGPDGSSWLPVRVVRIRGEGRHALTPAVLAMRPPGLPAYDIGPFVSCSTEHIPLDVWHSRYEVAGAAAGR